MGNPVDFSELFNPLGPGTSDVEALTKGVQGLSRNLKILQKNLDADGQKVAAGLAALVSQAATLRGAVSGLDALTDKERTSLQGLAQQVAGLAREQQRLKDAEAGIATVRRTATTATDQLTKSLREQQQALRQAFADNNTEGIRKAAVEILRLKASGEELTRALRGANSIYTATAGSYRAMENEARQLGGQLKALEAGVGSNSAEAQQLRARLAEVNSQLIKFGQDVNEGYRNVGRYAEGIRQAVGSLERQRTVLLEDAQALRTQAAAAGLSAAQQDKLQAEIAQTDVQLHRVNGELRAYGVGVQQAGGFTTSLGQGAAGLVQNLAGAYYGLQGVTTALQQVFEANVAYSRELAEVRKTTGLTADEAERLAGELKQLDTPTTLAGLLKIASIGGQLGYAKGELLGFTQAVDIATQALGNDFGTGAAAAETIATTLGRLGYTYRKELGPDIAQNLLAIGSAVNELGAVGSATAPYLVEYAGDVGAISSAAGVGLKNVLAYGAVLQENSYDAQVAATATNRLFNTLTTRTKEAYQIAKLANPALTLREFTKLINTDFNQAIQVFLAGLREGGKTTTQQGRLLATLKLQSSEAKNAIVTLAQNTGLFADRQATANEQLRQATSLQKEAAVNTDTLGGEVDKLGNSISNFVTSGVVGNFLKSLVRIGRETFGAVTGTSGFNGEIVKLSERIERQKNLGGSDEQAAAAKSLFDQAEAAQKLTDRYIVLQNVSGRTAAQQAEMSRIVQQLQAAIGSNVVQVDKDTRALTLNVLATQTAIDKKRLLLDNQRQSFSDQLALLDSEITDTQSRIDKQQLAASQAGLNLAAFGLDAVSIERVKTAAAARQEAAQLGIKSATYAKSLIPENQIQAATRLVNAEKELAASEKQLQQQQAQRAQVAANLAAVAKLGAKATQAQTKATDDDIEADKKKKQSVADVAKEEFLRRKQQLEARIADLDRQADSPANPFDLRNEAASKATELRKELAREERDELIREAAQANKGKVDGDKATAVVRLRLSEEFQTKTLEIERSGDKKLLALRNALLAQLAQVDRAALEQQVTDAEKVRDNVSKSYAERQQAARAAAHAQIELARLTRDAEVREAGGALDKIVAANLKFAQAQRQASQSVKVYDSQKDIDEQDARFARLLLTTEDLRAKQLTTDKDYYRQLRDLENERERQAIAALEAEYGETAEVVKRKAALRRKEREEQTEQERAAAAERQQIIQQSLATTSAIADAYFQVTADRRAADLDNLQHAKERELEVAGENATLRAQIEENYRKRELAARREAAKAEKAQALFSIAINTAQAVMSVLSTGGGAHYLDFGTSAGILSALVTAAGIAQAAAVAARPLPEYYKGRAGGPAEVARVAERGPELVGQPGSFRLVAEEAVMQLRAGDRVYTAPKTADLLAQHDLVEGRLIQRAQAADTERMTARLRQSAAVRQEAAQRAFDRANGQLLEEVRGVRRAVEQQEQLRLTEQGLERWSRRGDSWNRHVTQRYRHGRP